MRPLRRELQIVFQDPFGSLSPRMTVGQIVTEGLLVHEPALSRAGARPARRRRRSRRSSSIPPARNRYPHEFSGGQRQRIAIARAMILKPKLVVLDEPTSALDRSVQKQIVELLRDLQRAHDLSYLFISHDLAVVRAMADEIIVMKDGKVVERGTVEAIFDQPKEPYTRDLIAAAFLRNLEPTAPLEPCLADPNRTRSLARISNSSHGNARRIPRQARLHEHPRAARARARRRAPASSFVIQKHAATPPALRLPPRARRRAARAGRCPRGRASIPAEKRLAVHVEDHPLDYGDFEGIIPKGQYGGGTVLLWDRGTWEPEGDPRAAYAQGPPQVPPRRREAPRRLAPGAHARRRAGREQRELAADQIGRRMGARRTTRTFSTSRRSR